MFDIGPAELFLLLIFAAVAVAMIAGFVGVISFIISLVVRGDRKTQD